MKPEELDVFKLSHKLVLEIYKATEEFPDSERYGLIAQMRRSAASIPTNLIEGAHRTSKKEFAYFINISKGSCGEIKYQLLLSRDLNYIGEGKFKEFRGEYERVSMMLSKLHSSLK